MKREIKIGAGAGGILGWSNGEFGWVGVWLHCLENIGTFSNSPK
jgi:hypothetical protein